MTNCYVNGVRCVHLMKKEPWCDIYLRSTVTPPAIMDGSICGYYNSE